MTKKQIQDMYIKLYKKYIKQVKYYYKKYGISLDVPRKIKNPTAKSLERLENLIKENIRHAKSRAAYIRAHSVPRDKAAIAALYYAITHGFEDSDRGRWAAFKADTVTKLLDEYIPMGYTTDAKQRREGIARHIETNLPTLHDKIYRFVKMSNEAFETIGRASSYCWDIIKEAIPDFIYINYDTDDNDDYFYYNEETGEVYE